MIVSPSIIFQYTLERFRKVLITLQIYFLKPWVLCFDLRINTSMIKEQGTYNGPDEFLISGVVVKLKKNALLLLAVLLCLSISYLLCLTFRRPIYLINLIVVLINLIIW